MTVNPSDETPEAAFERFVADVDQKLRRAEDSQRHWQLHQCAIELGVTPDVVLFWQRMPGFPQPDSFGYWDVPAIQRWRAEHPPAPPITDRSEESTSAHGPEDLPRAPATEPAPAPFQFGQFLGPAEMDQFIKSGVLPERP